MSRYGCSIDNVNFDVVRKNALDFSKGYIEREKSLSFLFPEVSQDWDYDANWPLIPDNVAAFSTIPVQWKCSKGHTWITRVSGRTSNKNGCPYCSNHSSIGTIQGVNDLATTNPEVVAYWDTSKNGTLKPTDIRAGSYHRVWWKCPNCGYEWNAIVKYKVLAKNLCPQCGRFRKKWGQKKKKHSLGLEKQK